jgi:hypothetical protein
MAVVERTRTPRRRRAGVRNDFGTGCGTVRGNRGAVRMVGLEIVIGGTGLVMRGEDEEGCVKKNGQIDCRLRLSCVARI